MRGAVVLELPSLRRRQSPRKAPEAKDVACEKEFGITLPWARSCELPAGLAVPLERVHLWREEQEELGDEEQQQQQQQLLLPRANSNKRQRATDWRTAGIVVTSREGEGPCELAWSWEGERVVLRREGEARRVGLPVFSCVLLLRPAVHRERGQVVLTVRAAHQLQVVGSSKSIGLCGAKKKDGRTCGRLAPLQRRCAEHEEEKYHKQQSARMELNSESSHVPKKMRAGAKAAAAAGGKRKEPKAAPMTAEETVQKIAGEKAGSGLGARSLAALVGKDAPRVGPPAVTAAALREARAVTGAQGAFLHPNSWQLYQKTPKTDDVICLDSE